MDVKKHLRFLGTRLAFGYRYIFVRTYRWQLQQFGPSNAPEFVGASSVAWLIFFNLLTLITLIRLLTGFDLLFIDHTIWVCMSLGLGLHAIALYIYTRDDRYYAIAKEFERETELERKARGFYIWGYTLLSITLLVASMFTLRMTPLL